MSEFRFTDEEWRAYQAMPDQGQSHRYRLEYLVNRRIASIKADTIKGLLPKGAEFFPEDGGIVFEGKVYFPADYVLSRRDIAAISEAAWDERDNVTPQFLGPDSGHYDDECGGWEDCHCESYPNPYRAGEPA
jgi:hypothetical protein